MACTRGMGISATWGTPRESGWAMEDGSPTMGATEFATRYVPALAGTWVWARGRGRAMSLTRDSRP